MAAIANGVEVVDALEVGETDSFEFNVPQNGTVHLAVTQLGDIETGQPRISLLASDGTVVIPPRGDSDSSFQSGEELEAGEYTAIVSEDRNDDSLDYKLRLLVTPNEAQPIDGRDEDMLGSGEELVSQVGVGEFNFYRFDVPEDGAVRLSLGQQGDLSTGQPRITMVAPDGEVLLRDRGDSDSAVVEIGNLSPGQHTAVVYEDGTNDSLEYKLRLLIAPSAPELIAGRDSTTLTPENAFVSTVSRGEFNIHQFDVIEDGELNVFIQQLGELPGSQPRFSLFAPDGEPLTQGRGQNDAASLELINVDGGTYTAVVYEDGDSDLDYSISIEGTTTPIRIPLVTISSTSAAFVDEGAGDLSLNVTLSTTSANDVTVPFLLSGSAERDSDYAIGSTSVTVPAGQTSASISINLIDDSIDEDDETLVVSLGTPIGADLGSDTVLTTTINDNDEPASIPNLNFRVTSQSIDEDAGTAAIEVSLSAGAGTDVTVPFSVSGSATNGEDYSISNSPITIPAGQTSGLLMLDISDDEINEPAETIIVTLGSPMGATLGPDTVHTTTITDNDPQTTTTVAVNSTEQSVSEDAETLTFDIQLSAASDSDVLIPFAIGGTATSGQDFVAPSSPVIIMSGSTSATVTVILTDDAIEESDETIVFTLETPTGAELGQANVHTATILATDPVSPDTAPTFEIPGEFETPINVTFQSRPFIVRDPDTDIESLIYSFTSSDPTIVNESSISVAPPSGPGTGGGMGGNNGGTSSLALYVIPELDSAGSTEIVVSVSDGEFVASQTILFTVVDSEPVILTINRNDPLRQRTLADELEYRVTFNEPVVNVDATDFGIFLGQNMPPELAVDVTVVPVSDRVFDVRLASEALVNANGVVSLIEFSNESNQLPTNDIRDLDGNAIDDQFPTLRESFELDNRFQSVAVQEIKRGTTRNLNGIIPQVTDSDTLAFDIRFTDPIDSISATDFLVTGTTATVSLLEPALSSAGMETTVLLSGGDLANLNGTVGVRIAEDNSIIGFNGAPFDATEPELVETFTVTNPSGTFVDPEISLSLAGPAGIADPDDLPSGPQPSSFAIQRSELFQIVVEFDSAISPPSTDDILLTNLGLNADVDTNTNVALRDDQLNLSSDGLTLTLELDANQTSDGVYQLELGTAITGGDPFIFTGDSTNGFYVLQGDWNGSGGVNIQDFATFAYWFGQSVPPAPAYVDLNASGGINIQDFAGFAANFGRAVTFPGTVAPVTSDGAAEGELDSALNTFMNPIDTNGDGAVTRRDAVNIINDLQRNGMSEGDGYSALDANRDGSVSARDALYVINRIELDDVISQITGGDSDDDSSDAVDQLLSDDALLSELF